MKGRERKRAESERRRRCDRKDGERCVFGRKPWKTANSLASSSARPAGQHVGTVKIASPLQSRILSVVIVLLWFSIENHRASVLLTSIHQNCCELLLPLRGQGREKFHPCSFSVLSPNIYVSTISYRAWSGKCDCDTPPPNIFHFIFLILQNYYL